MKKNLQMSFDVTQYVSLKKLGDFFFNFFETSQNIWTLTDYEKWMMHRVSDWGIADGYR